MFERLPIRLTYSRAEYLSDAVVHVIGLLIVGALVPTLIVLAALVNGTDDAVIASSIYGGSLVAMIFCSAIYNMVPHADWEWLLKRLDHSAIYLKIAGTYTAFAMLAGDHPYLIGMLWVIAALGVTLKLLAPYEYRRVGLVLYLGLGWMAAVVGWEVFTTLPLAAVALIVAGGGIYTSGVIFYLWDRLPYHMAIWHVFVLTGSLAIYGGMTISVLA